MLRVRSERNLPEPEPGPTSIKTKQKVERLEALQERTRCAVRDLADRAEGERAAFRRLAADMKNHLRALPEVATAAIGAVQVTESGRLIRNIILAHIDKWSAAQH